MTCIFTKYELLVTWLQGKLTEVYFGFKKIEEIIYIDEEVRDKFNDDFNKIWQRRKITMLSWKLDKSE